MQQPFAELSRTGGIGTARHRLTHRPIRLGVTGRAVRRHDEGSAVRRTGFEEHAYHLRNNVAGTLDQDRIPNPDVFTPNLVFIVQGSATDGNARNTYWLQISRRRQGPRAPYTDVDRQHARGGLLRRKFKGNGPARMMSRRPQGGLQAKIIYLD